MMRHLTITPWLSKEVGATAKNVAHQVKRGIGKRSILPILLLAIGTSLFSQDLNFGIYTSTGATNLFSHFPESGDERGATFELGVVYNMIFREHKGIVASFQLGASHSSYSFNRFSGILATKARLLEAHVRAAVGYKFHKFELLPFVDFKYAVSGRFEGFSTRDTDSPYAFFDVNYNNIDEVAGLRIGVEDEYRLYADLGISLRYELSSKFTLGLSLSSTLSEVDFSFVSSELCINGACPNLDPINIFRGGWGTKQRATSTLTLFYYFE